MIVRVPNNLDVKELVSKLGLSETKSKNLKTKIYFFISRLVITYQNVETFEELEATGSVSGRRSATAALLRQAMRSTYIHVSK